ncbi:MAG: hypothetical protein ACRDNE_00605 [Gaiellaceae bacterium]
MPATVILKGEGGAEFEFDLPLSAPYAEQVRQGKLRGADEKSAKALAASGVREGESVEAAASESEEPQVPTGPPPKVGKGSGKAAWVTYAENVGIDPAGKSRAELIKASEASS